MMVSIQFHLVCGLFLATISSALSFSSATDRMTITFPATSNKVSPTKVKEPTDDGSLESAIRNNKAFTSSFETQEEDGFGMRHRRHQEPQKNICIIQSSTAKSDKLVLDSPKGLVTTVTQAYNKHHNLILRPDDVWQAILTQFSFYVNSKAELLRDKFVDFKGKKQLVVQDIGNLFSVDHGELANRMVDEQITKNIKDPTVVDWLLPGFSTTAPNDRVAASVSVMSTLKAYFEYKFELACGIPYVTLEGTPQDWKNLRQKLERLPTYDDPRDKLMTEWCALLAPVLDQFVLSAEGKPDLAFWDRICHHHGGGSGPRYLSGWITVFACFQKDGKWQGKVPFKKPHDQFGFNRDGREYVDTGEPRECDYPFINTNDLPIGALSVPVLVDDNGVEYNTHMVAGQFAFEIVDDEEGHHDTIRSRTDWCIAYDVDKQKNARKKLGQCSVV